MSGFIWRWSKRNLLLIVIFSFIFIASCSSASKKEDQIKKDSEANALVLNQNCKDFVQTIVIDGESVNAVGMACKRDDGIWQIVNSNSSLLNATYEKENLVKIPTGRFMRRYYYRNPLAF